MHTVGGAVAVRMRATRPRTRQSATQRHRRRRRQPGVDRGGVTRPRRDRDERPISTDQLHNGEATINSPIPVDLRLTTDR